MLIPNHPDDERLSALASHDEDATRDGTLTSHVTECVRCTGLVSELGALRLSLADLPDLQPSRPLQLLPPVAEAPGTADGLVAWVRRAFAPVVTAGAALALVGIVGTAMPALDGMAAGGATSAEADNALDGGQEAFRASEAAAPVNAPAGEAAASDAVGAAGSDGRTASADESPPAEEDTSEPFAAQVPATRSPWPMVLFTGVALVVAAVLLRWIVVPRAG